MGDMTVKQGEIARSAIKVGMLINRLQEHIHGREVNGERVEVDLSATQIAAAKILLDKSLPSLQSADITAHSSPVVESQDALMAKLAALIQSNPLLIKQLAEYNAKPALEGELGDDSVSQTPHAALLTPVIPDISSLQLNEDSAK